MIFKATGSLKIEVPAFSRDGVRKILELGKTYSLSLSGKGVLSETATGGIAVFQLSDCMIGLKDGETRSLKLNDTLRGIERMIFFAQNGRDPKDKEVEYIHEALLEEYAQRIMNPVTGRMMMLRTSMMNNKELCDFIDCSIGMLCSLEIPEEIIEATGSTIKELFVSWYDWRYNHHAVDPLHDSLPGTWNKYCTRYPVCEFCGIGSLPGDKLERMHIVSVGSDDKNEEEPWNWIRSHHSHHMEQHQNGWAKTLTAFPHIKGKVDAATRLAGKKDR